MGYRAYIRRRSSPASPDAFDATSERPAFSKPLRARHFPTLKRPAICLKKVIGYKSSPIGRRTTVWTRAARQRPMPRAVRVALARSTRASNSKSRFAGREGSATERLLMFVSLLPISLRRPRSETLRKDAVHALKHGCQGINQEQLPLPDAVDVILDGSRDVGADVDEFAHTSPTLARVQRRANHEPTHFKCVSFASEGTISDRIRIYLHAIDHYHECVIGRLNARPQLKPNGRTTGADRLEINGKISLVAITFESEAHRVPIRNCAQSGTPIRRSEVSRLGDDIG